MVATLLQVSAVASPAAAENTLPGVPSSERPVEGAPAGKGEPRLKRPAPVPAGKPDATWPEAGASEVTLKKAENPGSPKVQAKSMPLKLGVAKAEKAGAPESVRARILDRAATERAGIQGVLLALDNQDGKPAADDSVSVSLEYGSFAEAYGAGYGSRLTLVSLPECVLDKGNAASCGPAEPIDTENDTEKHVLTAPFVPLGKEGTLLAAVADDSGPTGDYKATDLSAASSWSTDLNSGDFNWQYAFDVPTVPGGLAPQVGISYSSGAIDGRSSGTNNQGSWIGDGFNYSPGSIERRYKPCAEDNVENADGNKPGDLCWDYDNAFLSFNGKGGELVPIGDNAWKLKQDDGTLIQRLTDTARGNGDNDGEYWRLTDAQGNRYYFGYNRLPGWSDGKETTGSTWTVPVFGNDAGEECHKSTFAASWCQQAWRWNLDYAVDVRGNAIAYYYNQEKNSYGRNLEAKDNTRYVRGGHLDRIEYGLQHDSVYSAQALAKVDFTSSERCIEKNAGDCADIEKNAFHWYDTPWDANCPEVKDCDKGRYAPTFWTRKRLTGVTTEVLKTAGSGYEKVDSWKLTHRWEQADVDYQLVLDAVQRTGHTGDSPITLPKTTLSYTQLVNRMDKTGDGYPPFVRARLSTIEDESGGRAEVNYTGPACDSGNLPTPQSNTTRCYPQIVDGQGDEKPTTHWYNKYVVDQLTLTDRTGGAPDQVTRYEYLGGAAWHYDDSDGMVEDEVRTWSQWRGYGHVRVLDGGQGGTSAMKSQSDSYYLRGMNGDRKEPSGGTKSVAVTLGDGEGDPITDHESAGGFLYKSVGFSGPGGKVLGKTVERPWHHETAKKARDWGTIRSHFTGTANSRTWTSTDDGAGKDWRITSKSTTYDTNAGRVQEIDNRGDNSTAADNQCTRHEYVPNEALNILAPLYRTETVSVSCAETPDRKKDVVSDILTAYDGKAYGTAPQKGDPTGVATLKSHDGTTATYLENGATFDSYGRPLTSTTLAADVTVTGTSAPKRTTRTDASTSTTAYSPTTGRFTTITTTSQPATPGQTATAQKTVTTVDPRRGVPLASTDTNGKITTRQYDALGRETKIWLPDRKGQTLPNYAFDYYIEEGKPTAVRTRTLGNSGGAVLDSYELYDGHLRPRQTQSPGIEGGRIISDILYDERGLTSRTYAPYYTQKPASRDLFLPNDALSVETQTWHTYDGMGRETEQRQVAGTGDGHGERMLALTRTLHGGDRTTVIPPEGAAATTSLIDAQGRTTELRTHRGRSVSDDYDTIRYSYNKGGLLQSATDPMGNTWSYTYDQRGRVTETVDPDAGKTVQEYDDRDQVVSTTDARGRTVHQTYDGLGRQTALRDEGPSGKLRAQWEYDTVSGAKGLLASSTRFVDGAEYTSKITKYDALYRPERTAVVIPASEGELAGTYQASTSFHPSGLVQGTSLSAAGSLPIASQTYQYDEALRPVGTITPGGQSTTLRSFTGKPLQQKFQETSSAKHTQITQTFEHGTQRLATSRVDRQGGVGVDRSQTYRYDQVGNILSVSDVNRDRTDTQCYTYDHLRRLTQGWTQSTKECADKPSADVVGGIAPYWDSYTYDKAGNRLTEVRHGHGSDAGKDVTRDYAYPPAGGPQPHTLSEVTESGPVGTSKTAYAYDPSGNTTERMINGDTQKLSWDAEGKLVRVTQPVEGKDDEVTEYLYDADGNRLIARTATETTLYLGHTEVTLAEGATKAKATRYFDLGDGHQLVLDDARKATVTIADHQGTGQLAVTIDTKNLTQRRTTPFGQPRGDQPQDWPGTRSFVGGIDDTATTGLTHLSAREYDPETGRFISVDPILDLTDSQQIHGYTYANNSPVTFNDPTGLRPEGACGGSNSSCNGGTESWTKKGGNWSWSDTRETGKSRDWNTTYYTTTTYTFKSGLSKKHYSITLPSESGNFSGTKPMCGVGDLGAACRKVGEVFLGLISNAFHSAEYYAWPIDDDCWGDVGPGSPGCDYGANFDQFVSDHGFDTESPAYVVPAVIHALRKGMKDNGMGGQPAKGKTGSAPRGNCSSNSFVAGTRVLMADGSTKPIEDVGVGDQVIATDPASGVTAIETVTAEIVGQGLKRLVRLDIELNDEAGAKVSITATSGHPFWLAESKVWVDAASVQPGDQVATLSEGRARVLNTSHTYALDARVYNLTTSSTHTYYVLAGQTPVLVHNSGGCITMSSAIGGDSSLVKAAQQAGKNQKVQADLDSLFQQLSRGNMNPGLGSKALSGTDVTYARGRNGGRLFFRNVDGGIQVVGKSDKANESKVIARLNQLYGQ
ncbi:polymorphic toxin-type HINT domain-containing protein [Streptomyces albidoflavus]|uniref:polymorphic toxin-type HINT domain-containing protein n=1 Tax=Streptomyces albidoflavus TaxID=1886 RepID=UPI0033D5D067